MKKLLLSLAMAMGIISVAGAVEVTDVLSKTKIGSSGTTYKEYTLTSSQTTSGAAYAFQCAAGNDAIQLRYDTTKDPSGIVSTTSGGALKKITVTWNENTGNNRVLNIYAANEAFTIAGLNSATDAPTPVTTMKFVKSDASTHVATYEFTGDYKYIGIRSNKDPLYLESIEITWEQAAPAVDRPVITNDNGTVTITAGASGADAIYYTINGDDPTDQSKQYTEPFTVTESCTVKAIAKKGTDLSKVAALDVTVLKVYDGFAAFLATNPAKDTEALIDGPITAIYQNGSNMYVKDSKDGYMLLYKQGGFTGVTTVNGTQFASVKGSYSPTNGKLPELINIEFGAKVEETAVVEPKAVTIPDITLDMVNEYVKIADVDIDGTTPSFIATDANGKTITLYNSLKGSNYNPEVTVPTGKGFTVTGFVSRHNNTIQITPVAFEGGQVMEYVSAPVFSVASGDVVSGTAVTISCPTEGAEIRYTIGDAVPDGTSKLYEGDAIVINTDTKINAIAYKEGMLASGVVSVSYTVLPEGTKLATFNFGDPTTLSPAITMPAANEIDVVGETFTAENGVTLSIGSAVEEGVTNPSSQKSRIFKSGDIIDLRIYKGWSFTVTAPAKHKLIKIQMATAGGSISLNASEGSFASGTWSAPTEAALAETTANDVKSVKFTANSNSRIQTIKVYVVPVSGQNGIEDVIMGDEDAPVEYYNLQGVRVMNPTAGLYIVKQGGKVSKAVIR